MGVITSVPAPIKVQLQDIQSTKTDYVLDSAHYNSKLSFIKKALSELSKNQKIQKVTLKFFFQTSPKEDLTKSISRILEKKATVVIYGSNLQFFEHPRWLSIWSNTKSSNLQIKFEMLMHGFDHLAKGIACNKNLRILGFRYLDDFQLKTLGGALSSSTVYHLLIILEPRKYEFQSSDEGIHSGKMPSTPQMGAQEYFLRDVKSITTFTLGGFQERCSFIYGISMNNSIQTLILDNIDIEKSVRQDFNVAFKQNSSIKELKCIHGLNALSALIIFQSLRKNASISSLLLEENVFYDHGFTGLETYLKITKCLKSLNIKNLLHLNITQHFQMGSLANLTTIISGISENTSLVEVYIGNHPNVSLEVQQLEKTDNLLSEAFFKLFSCNRSLKILSIEYFRLGSESFSGISAGLARNKSLEGFSMVGNLMSWDDFSNFTNELLKNECLINLDLSINALRKGLDTVGLDVLDSAFGNLARVNIKSFKMDLWFWERSNYRFETCAGFDEARAKYY